MNNTSWINSVRSAFYGCVVGMIALALMIGRSPPNPPLTLPPPSAEVIRVSAAVTEARRAGIPWELALAVSRHEVRNADSMARGRAGEVGLFQVRPEFWRTRFPECYPERPLWNPERNACIGVRVLREKYEQHGNWPDALKAYNGSLRLPTEGADYLKGVDRQRRLVQADGTQITIGGTE